MAVLSTLCRLNRVSKSITLPTVSKLLVAKQQNVLRQALRYMSGDDEDRKMYITPTRYHYTRFKDDLHFYLSIGIVPLTLLILYVNIFIGPATLTEIPEGYQPRHWEYFKHPISRFIARNFCEDPQIMYERSLHDLVEDQERIEWGNTIEKANKLMVERDDYKAWYYRPSDQGRQIRYARYETDKILETKGWQ